MSEPRPVDDQVEILQLGREPSRYGEGFRRLAGRLFLPLVVAIAVAVAWFEMADTERERTAARADELAAAAVDVLETDIELARLLALAAADASPSPSASTMAALRQTLSTNLLATYTWSGRERTDPRWTDLSADGRLLLATGTSPAGAYLEVLDVAAGAVVWSTDVAEIGYGSTGIEFPFFSPDGEWVVAGLTVEPVPAAEPLGVIVWDADTGAALHRVGVGRCGAIVDAVSDTHLLVTSPQNDTGTCWLERLARLELIDIETGHRRLLTSQATWFQPRAMSADGRAVTFTAISPDGLHDVVVVDTATGEEVLSLDGTVYTHGLGHPRLLNNDGSLLLAGRGPVEVWDVASRMPVATIDVQPASVRYAGFAPDGDSVFTTGSSGFHRWNALDGTHVAAMPRPGLPAPDMFSLAGDLALVRDGPPTVSALLISTGPRRDVTVIKTCFGLAGTLSAAGGHAALGQVCGAGEPVTYLAELAADVVRVVPGQLGQGLALSPDGSRFVRQDASDVAEGGPPDAPVGPVRIRDFATGDVLVDLEAPGPSMWVVAATWSEDGRLIAAVDMEQEAVIVWDATSGRLVERYDGCWFGVADAAFAPGNELIVSCHGRQLVALSSDSWAETRAADIEPGSTPLGIVGFDADGSTLLTLDHEDGHGSLYWIDTATFAVTATAEDVFDDPPTARAMDQSGSLAAVGTADGRVQVWDVEQRAHIDEIEPDGSPGGIAGVAFTGDGRLAVALRHGEVHLHLLDPGEVIAAVRRSVTRDLSPAECARYRLDACPSELGGDPAPGVSGAQIITGLPSGSAM